MNRKNVSHIFILLLSVPFFFSVQLGGDTFSLLDPNAQPEDLLYNIYINTETGKVVDANGKPLKGRLPGAPDFIQRKGLKEKIIGALKKTAGGSQLTATETLIVSTLGETIKFLGEMNSLLRPLRGQTFEAPTKLEVATFIGSAVLGATRSVRDPIDVIKERLLQRNNPEFSKAVMTEIMNRVKTKMMSALQKEAKELLERGQTGKKVNRLISIANTGFNILNRVAKGEQKWYDTAVLKTVNGGMIFADWMRTRVRKKETIYDKSTTTELLRSLLENKAAIGNIIAKALDTKARSLIGDKSVDIVEAAGKVGLSVIKTTVAGVKGSVEVVSYVVERRDMVPDALGSAFKDTVDVIKESDIARNTVWVVQQAKSTTGEMMTNVAQVTQSTLQSARDTALVLAQAGVDSFAAAAEKGRGALVAMGEAGKRLASGTGTTLVVSGSQFIESASSLALGTVASFSPLLQSFTDYDTRGLAYGLGWADEDPDEEPTPKPVTAEQMQQLAQAYEESEEYIDFVQKAELILGGNLEEHGELIEAIGKAGATKAILTAMTKEDLTQIDAEGLREFLSGINQEELAYLNLEVLRELQKNAQELLGKTPEEAALQLKLQFALERLEEEEFHEMFEDFHSADLAERIQKASPTNLESLAFEVSKITSERDKTKLIELLKTQRSGSTSHQTRANITSTQTLVIESPEEKSSSPRNSTHDENSDSASSGYGSLPEAHSESVSDLPTIHGQYADETEKQYRERESRERQELQEAERLQQEYERTHPKEITTHEEPGGKK